MKLWSSVASLLTATTLMAACTAPDSPTTEPVVTIMTFNVQNLFDNIDDPGKDDKAYLPVGAKQDADHIDSCNEIAVESWRNECLDLDWDDAAVAHKLSVIAEAIRQTGDGRGPDIIALQEVENAAVLDRLRTEFLADSGYQPAILVEGTDVRGIDVAFLSRLPATGAAVLHPFDLPEQYKDRAGDTRGVLEATFEMPDGSLLTGFSVHFPAPFHPPELRVLAYEHLARLRAAVPAGHAVFAAGDFNTTSREDASDQILDRFLRPEWYVSNDYCDDCAGNYYYAPDSTWSFLDMVIFTPAEDSENTWQVRSAEIANRFPPQVTADGKPNRYDAEARSGVSDHWPVVMTLVKAQ